MSPFVRVFLVLILSAVSCSTIQKKSPSQKSTEQLISFVETGDSTLLSGIFTDELLNRMSIEAMLDTRNDFVQSFGKLETIDGPEFSTDSTAGIILRYKEMSLVSSLEFNSDGKIRFLSIRPEPVISDSGTVIDTTVSDITQFADFRGQFNSDSNYVRLVAILSPTCPMCREQGYSAAKSVLMSARSNSLRSYIIWLPALSTDTRNDAIQASAELNDDRVKNYWDGEMRIANPVGKSLGLSRFAWDVYLLYGRGAKWEKESPTKPKFWMHQLMGAEGLAPTLDSVVLRWKVEELLKAK